MKPDRNHSIYSVKRVISLFLCLLVFSCADAQLQCYNHATNQWEPCGGGGGGGGGGANTQQRAIDDAAFRAALWAAQAEMDRRYAEEVRRVEEARINAQSRKLNRKMEEEYRKKLRDLSDLSDQKKQIQQYIDQIMHDEAEFKARRDKGFNSMKGEPVNGRTIKTGEELKSIGAADDKARDATESIQKGGSGQGFENKSDYAGSITVPELHGTEAVDVNSAAYKKAFSTLTQTDEKFKARVADRDAKQKECDDYVKQRDALNDKIKSLVSQMSKPDPPKDISLQLQKSMDEKVKVSLKENDAQKDLYKIQTEVNDKVEKTIKFQKENLNDIYIPAVKPAETPKQ